MCLAIDHSNNTCIYQSLNAAGVSRISAPAHPVIYEAHIPSFTPDGTFASAVAKLDHVASLGVNILQLMPVSLTADVSPGGGGWGCSSPLEVLESYPVSPTE